MCPKASPRDSAVSGQADTTPGSWGMGALVLSGVVSSTPHIYSELKNSCSGDWPDESLISPESCLSLTPSRKSNFSEEFYLLFRTSWGSSLS